MISFDLKKDVINEVKQINYVILYTNINNVKQNLQES